MENAKLSTPLPDVVIAEHVIYPRLGTVALFSLGSEVSGQAWRPISVMLRDNMNDDGKDLDNNMTDKIRARGL